MDNIEITSYWILKFLNFITKSNEQQIYFSISYDCTEKSEIQESPLQATKSLSEISLSFSIITKIEITKEKIEVMIEDSKLVKVLFTTVHNEENNEKASKKKAYRY